MREPSRAGGGGFGAEFCAKTKTDNPAKTQSEKISAEKRIAFAERARSRLVSADLVARKKRCKLSSSCDQFRGLSLDDSTRFAVSRGRERKAAKSAKLNERVICCRLLVHASLLSRPRPFGGARQEKIRRSLQDVARAFPCNRKYCMPKARFRFHPYSGGDHGHPAL